MYDAQKKRDIQTEVHEDGVWTPTCCMHALKQRGAPLPITAYTHADLYWKSIDRQLITCFTHAAAFEGGLPCPREFGERKITDGFTDKEKNVGRGR
jgi:hypothetical protein